MFFSPKRPDRLWGPPSCLLNGNRGVLSPGCESHRLLHCNVDVKRSGAVPLLTLYAFMACTVMIAHVLARATPRRYATCRTLRFTSVSYSARSSSSQNFLSFLSHLSLGLPLFVFPVLSSSLSLSLSLFFRCAPVIQVSYAFTVRVMAVEPIFLD